MCFDVSFLVHFSQFSSHHFHDGLSFCTTEIIIIIIIIGMIERDREKMMLLNFWVNADARLM